MQRRQFIKSSCNICLLAGSGFLLSELGACGPAYQVVKTEIINNQVQIPVAGFTQSGLQFVRPKGWLYDLAVMKKNDGTYEAILLQCTHQSNQLIPAGNGYTCSLHGSQFNKEGVVTKGPASHPLKKYPVAIDHENLIINLNQS